MLFDLGRVAAWSLELEEYDLHFVPRTAIKGQVLADFVAEFSSNAESTSSGDSENQENFCLEQPLAWRLFVDGSACNKGSGEGIVLVSPDGLMLEQSLRLNFKASNNEAEYEALIYGLKCALHYGADILQVHCDSQLVVNQLSGEYATKDARMAAYAAAARDALSKFSRAEMVQVTSSQNSHADALARLASAVTTEMRRTILIDALQ